MRKNLTIIVLVFAIILQLSVPVCMIAYSKNVEDALLQYGKEFKVKVNVHYAYEGSIDFKADGHYNWYTIGDCAIIEADADGYANLFENVGEDKPQTDDYIRVTMDNKAKLADYQIDSDIIAWGVYEDSAYIVIKVYKGNFEILGLYMDDIPAEEWFKTAIAEKDENGDVNLFSKK